MIFRDVFMGKTIAYLPISYQLGFGKSRKFAKTAFNANQLDNRALSLINA